MQTDARIDQNGKDIMQTVQRIEQDDEVQGYSDGSVAAGGLLSLVGGGLLGFVAYTSYVIVHDATK